MAFDPLRQWRQDRPAVRGDPAFAQVAGRLRRNHQVLDQKRFMTFENRSWRDIDTDHFVLDLDPRGDLTPARPLDMIGGFCSRSAFVHTTQLDVRLTSQTFQPHIVFAQIGDGLLQLNYLSHRTVQPETLKLDASARKGGGRGSRKARHSVAEDFHRTNGPSKK